MTMNTQFQSFYQKIYEDRWPRLLECLAQPLLQVARWNLFLKENFKPDLPLSEVQLSDCFLVPSAQQERQQDLLPFYVMDPASVLVARILPVEPSQKILDMCAAPGGKSLILAEALMGTGELWCNELSMDRRGRLKKVLQNYIPQEKRMQTWIKGADGLQYGMRFPEAFDAILLDAPCSGEAHLLEDAAMLAKWTPNWSKKNAARQYGLISSAYLALKPGGFLVYSTCSLSPLENERVIEKILDRREDLKVVDPLTFFEIKDELRSFVQKYGEAKNQGYLFLPDHCGFGPLYFCLLRKYSAKAS